MLLLLIFLVCIIATVIYAKRVFGISDNLDFFVTILFGIYFGLIVLAVTLVISLGMFGTKIEIVETDNPNVVKIIKVVDNEFLQEHLFIMPWDLELQAVNIDK